MSWDYESWGIEQPAVGALADWEEELLLSFMLFLCGFDRKPTRTELIAVYSALKIDKDTFVERIPCEELRHFVDDCLLTVSGPSDLINQALRPLSGIDFDGLQAIANQLSPSEIQKTIGT